MILGLGGQFHDANLTAATLDGQVLEVLEEERFSRHKHHQGPPEHCLALAGPTFQDADTLVVASPFEELQDLPPGTFYARGFLPEHQSYAALPSVPIKHRCVHHHLAHAAYARAVAGREEMLVITCDALGSGAAGGAFYFSDAGVEHLCSVPAEHSLGVLWEQACEHLNLFRCKAGFYVSKPGILTGLAGFGAPSFFERFLASVRLCGRNGWTFRTPLAFDFSTPDFVSPDLIAAWTDMNWDDIEVGPGTPAADLAASLQALTEHVVLQWVEELLDDTSPPALAVSGGIALNPGLAFALEQLCARRGIPFMNPPAPSDAGSGLGAAAAVLSERGVSVTLPRRFPFMGPRYGPEVVIEAAEAAGARFRDWGEQAHATAAARIVHGQIVAWCSGGSEHGPRALGARSLLADPRRMAGKDELNRLKGRAAFRPVAPAALEGEHRRAFDGQGSPFMNVNTQVTEWGRQNLPAATHADGSARLQTVPPDPEHPLFHLLTEVRRRTGFGCALNTSFNRQEPLVETPSEAIATARRMGLRSVFFDGVEVFTE